MISVSYKFKPGPPYSLRIPLTCRQCGYSWRVAAQRLTNGSRHSCSRCGAVIRIAGDGARQAQRSLDNFRKNLARTFR